MTLAQVRAYGVALAELERARLMQAAVAARVAQADQAQWRRWLRETQAS